MACTGLRILVQRAGLDRAVLCGVLARIWGVVTGPVTLLLIASHFTAVVQGYYYTFGSLLALQVFAELGLGQVIIQFASHEWSRLDLDRRGRIIGEPDALSRLVSLGRVTFRWYGAAAVLAATLIGLVGYKFFSRSPDPAVGWVAPWFALCLLTGINLYLVPVWSLLEGCNQVSHVYAFRLVQGVVMSVSLWGAIALGAGLWAGPVASALGLLCAGVYLARRYLAFLGSFFKPATDEQMDWWREIWPMQWRIALSWLSGYFVFSLFTPVLFRYHGPIAAGQMGMTWTLVSALSGISSTWVLTKAPRFGLLIARKQYADLDRLFFRAAAASLALASAGAAAVWLVIYGLYALGHPLASRLLPPVPSALFLIATVLMQVSVPQSTYLRAHKREPFLGLSVVSGVMIGLSTWLLGRWYGATGMAAGYLAVVALGVPTGTFIWYRCRAEWHQDRMV